VPDDPATEPARAAGDPDGPPADGLPPVDHDAGDPAARRQAVVTAGHVGDAATARAALSDPDPSVREAAVGAVSRLGAATPTALTTAMADADATVRRRAVQEAGAAVTHHPDDAADTHHAAVGAAVRAALSDDDALVVEMACWAVGEWRTAAAVPALSATALGHGDTRCREAAVAALGAVGDPAGLEAVLGALADKPTVRRRAVVALAAFDGPEVDDALRRSLDDRDWQVREAAAILLEDSS